MEIVVFYASWRTAYYSMFSLIFEDVQLFSCIFCDWILSI